MPRSTGGDDSLRCSLSCGEKAVVIKQRGGLRNKEKKGETGGGPRNRGWLSLRPAVFDSGKGKPRSPGEREGGCRAEKRDGYYLGKGKPVVEPSPASLSSGGLKKRKGFG